MNIEELKSKLNDYAAGWQKLADMHFKEDTATTNGGFTWDQILIAFNQDMRSSKRIIDIIIRERDSLILNGIIDIIHVYIGLTEYKEYYFFKREAVSIDHKAEIIANEVYRLLGNRLENIELSLGLIEDKDGMF